MRDNTERPITVEIGTNELVGRDLGRIGAAIEKVLAGERKTFAIPPLWDGHAGQRIAEVILGNGNVRISDSDNPELECVVGSKTD